MAGAMHRPGRTLHSFHVMLTLTSRFMFELRQKASIGARDQLACTCSAKACVIRVGSRRTTAKTPSR